MAEGDKKKIIILAVLISVSVIVWLRGLRGRPAAAGRSDTVINGSALSPEHSRIGRRRRTDYKAWGRNPFVISSAPVSGFTGLQLGGIVYDVKDSYALINDEIVHTGDEINGNKVIKIEQNKVILNDGAKDIELIMEQ